jgi:hypothetical protein
MQETKPYRLVIILSSVFLFLVLIFPILFAEKIAIVLPSDIGIIGKIAVVAIIILFFTIIVLAIVKAIRSKSRAIILVPLVAILIGGLFFGLSWSYRFDKIHVQANTITVYGRSPIVEGSRSKDNLTNSEQMTLYKVMESEALQNELRHILEVTPSEQSSAE